jgi:ATP-dependent RNA helicase DeaD
MRTREESDVVAMFADAYATKPVHPDDLSLARRLMTHTAAENIIAGLLRDHLGARKDDPKTAAAEARRAKNPAPVATPPAVASTVHAAPVPAPPVRVPPRPRREEARREEPSRREEPRHEPRPEDPAAAESREDEPGFVRLFLNVGRRDGARAQDLQQMLTDHAGITRDHTGRIRIRDRVTFVSVREDDVTKAIAALAGRTIGGRTVVAEPAKEK